MDLFQFHLHSRDPRVLDIVEHEEEEFQFEQLENKQQQAQTNGQRNTAANNGQPSSTQDGSVSWDVDPSEFAGIAKSPFTYGPKHFDGFICGSQI